MTQVQLIAESGDELGIGELQTGTPTLAGAEYHFAIHLNLEAVGGSWDIFHDDLIRNSGHNSWNYSEVHSERQERIYYFRGTSFSYVKVTAPVQPVDSFTVTGRDPFTTPVDINYLLKGDRFRAERELTGGRKEVRYGVAVMDGHAISQDFGWLAAEAKGGMGAAEAKLKAYGPGSGNQYINVHWSDVDPAEYANSVRADRRRGIQYVPSGPRWPNEGLSLSDGWKVYSTPEVARRKAKADRDHRETLRQAKEDKDLEDAKRKFQEAAATIARIENKRKAK